MSELMPDQPTQTEQLSNLTFEQAHETPDMRTGQEPEQTRSLPWKRLGAGVAVVAIGAGAFLMGRSSGEDTEPIAATDTTTTVLEEDTEEPVTSPSTESTTSTVYEGGTTEYPIETSSRRRAEEERIPTDSEIVTVHDLRLALPEGDDPETILRAISFNNEQISNYIRFLDPDEQYRKNEEFLKYLVTHPFGNLGGQYFETFTEIQNQRQRDIYYEVYVDYMDTEIVRQFSDMIQVETTMVTTFNDGSRAENRKLISLNPAEVDTPNGPRTLWLLFAEEIIEENA